MSVDVKIRELSGELEKCRRLLESILRYYGDFKARELPGLGKGRTAGVVLAEIFVDYYTCVETFFFRTSQVFENHLNKDKWHSELLHKMNLDVPGVRAPVIQEDTAELLAELLRFRHFKRYYFQLEYDWDRLEFLERKFLGCSQLLQRDLKTFGEFLVKMV